MQVVGRTSDERMCSRIGQHEFTNTGRKPSPTDNGGWPALRLKKSKASCGAVSNRITEQTSNWDFPRELALPAPCVTTKEMLPDMALIFNYAMGDVDVFYCRLGLDGGDDRDDGSLRRLRLGATIFISMSKLQICSRQFNFFLG